MATQIWRGDAVAVAQVTTATPANVEIGDVFTLTINGKSVSFTATAATVANVTAGLTTAWNNSTIPEFAEVTASDQTTHVRLTADTAGTPFTVSSSTTDGGGANTQTLTMSTTTASAGPFHWDTASNWSTGTVPTTGDVVFLPPGTSAILYGLDASYVALSSLTVARGYTQPIGLPYIHSGQYVEYRERYLKVGPATITIGFDDASLSGAGASGINRCQIDTGSVQTTLQVLYAGQGINQEGAVIWKGTHASNVVQVQRGAFSAAPMKGETATISVLRVGSVGGGSSDAIAALGPGVTLGLVQQRDGVLIVANGATTITKTGGETIVVAGAVTTAHVWNGNYRQQGTGTITTLNVGSTGLFDVSRALVASTVTTANVYKGGRILDPNGVVTWTNPIAIKGCDLTDVSLDLGDNRNVQVS